MARRGIRARIDEGELEKLAMLQCTDEEVAAWFGVTTRTIERRRKTGKFAEIMERGKAKGRISLRRTQMRLAEQGSGSVAIWLGKQLLGQTDHFYHDVNGPSIQIVCPVGIAEPAVSLAPDAVVVDISGPRADYPRA